MMNSPKISIVMPVWNGERFIAEAVDSILRQTFSDFELIVVDDGSTDATPEILHACQDPRLRIHHLDHAGIVVALNFGIEHARAAWIARLDADDISMPHRLETQWRVLNSKPDAVLSHADVELIGEESASAGRAKIPSTRAFTALKLCYQCPIVHSTVMFKRETFLAAGGYRLEERHAEDYSLWGRMLELGTFAGVPEKLVKFRVHPQSVSRQNLEIQLALTGKIAIQHCGRFMQLPLGEAERAHAILNKFARKRTWDDWWWFLTHCAPRLRWHSVEAWGWLLRETLKVAAAKFNPARAGQ